MRYIFGEKALFIAENKVPSLGIYCMHDIICTYYFDRRSNQTILDRLVVFVKRLPCLLNVNF